MILDYIRDNLDGDSWEKWCDDCYRDRFQDQNYVKIPSEYLGDAGIEGFTHSGIVYQCYCPEKNYTDDELYEHLRDKATTDISKLINKDNVKRLLKLGVGSIKEWHFVIPEYKDKRIIEHLETKRLEVLAAKTSDPDTYSYIDPDIRFVPKTAEDFKVEFVRLIRNPLVDLKLNMAVKSIKDVDWTNCEAEKIENIKRKLNAIMSTDENDSDFKEMLKYWAEAYLKGLEIMNTLQKSYGAIYEDLLELEQQYKMDVSAKSKMNKNNTVNFQLFNEILDNFEKTIAEQFNFFSLASTKELKRDLVSGWLADCSLEFKAGD
jgi:hypothetical protein